MDVCMVVLIVRSISRCVATVSICPLSTAAATAAAKERSLWSEPSIDGSHHHVCVYHLHRL